MISIISSPLPHLPRGVQAHGCQRKILLTNALREQHAAATPIDDTGVTALPKKSGEDLLEVIMRRHRHENRPTIILHTCYSPSSI